MRAIVTKCARRDSRRLTGGRANGHLADLAREKRGQVRAAIRDALRTAADPEHWDSHLNIKPVTGWDVT